MEEINAELLKGLTFKTSEVRKVKDENGRAKTSFVSVARPLKPDDVLDWKDCSGKIVIVAKDGRKYTVETEEAPKGKAAKGGDGGAN
jgi:hypothetical protein